MMKICTCIILFILLLSCSRNQKVIVLCPNVLVHTNDKIDFTDAEKRLACGDQEVAAYQKIPAYQAQFSMQGFLESKGYVKPEFKEVDGVLHVYPKDEVELKKVTVTSEKEQDNKDLQKTIYRHYRKEDFSPSFLNDVENEAKSLLRNRGYPCATVKSEANVDTGEVKLSLDKLQMFRFGDIEKEDIYGIDKRALERFYPFTREDFFSEEELKLTEKRFSRSGIVQATFFREKCDVEKNEFSISQEFIVGPPHTIRFGVGASTELGPLARVKWSNQRFGNSASLLEANLIASFKSQSLKLTNDQYFWVNHPRRSLLSELSLTRNSQSEFDEILGTLRPHMKWTRDHNGRFWMWTAGPSFLSGTFKTDKTSATKKYASGAIEGKIQTQTHSYEKFDAHPQTGDFTEATFDLRHPATFAKDSLLKLDLNFSKILFITHWGRGDALFAFSVNGATTWVKDSVPIENLAPSVKFYGGGSTDLRGYKLATLPDNGGLGALSRTGMRWEFRKTNFFNENLEGFTFLDWEYFGLRSWHLEDRLWYSPGLGTRWISPIGLVEVYLARALASKSSLNYSQDNGFNYFIGLGGTF